MTNTSTPEERAAFDALTQIEITVDGKPKNVPQQWFKRKEAFEIFKAARATLPAPTAAARPRYIEALRRARGFVSGQYDGKTSPEAHEVLDLIDNALRASPRRLTADEHEVLRQAIGDSATVVAGGRLIETPDPAVQSAPTAEHQHPKGTQVNHQQVVVDRDYPWQPMSTCPHNAKVQLLGGGGIAYYGSWNGKDTWPQRWAPLPKLVLHTESVK